MDSALATFHEHKDVFLRDDIRPQGHFNIPKIHALLHYTSSIRLHGTPDGYNTELPERLHIDFAKRAYRASNKRNYTIQMARWLTRHEAVNINTAYVDWLSSNKENADDKSEDEAEADSDPDIDSDTQSDISNSQEPEPATTTVTSSIHYFAKVSPLPRLPVQLLSDHFRAVDLLPAVQSYLHSIPNIDYQIPTLNDRFNVYKKVAFHLGMPGEPETLIVDSVRATPSKGPSPLQRLGKQPHFDAVLIQGQEGGMYWCLLYSFIGFKTSLPSSASGSSSTSFHPPPLYLTQSPSPTCLL